MNAMARQESRRIHFIHVAEDEEFVTRLSSTLAARGIEAHSGSEVAARKAPAAARLDADAFIPIVSPPALSSEWWRTETGRATGEGVQVVPVVRRDLGRDEMPRSLRGLTWVDFRDDDRFDAAVEELVSILDPERVTRPMSASDGPAADAEDAGVHDVVLHLEREGEAAPFELATTPEAARVLLRAARFGERRNEPFDLSFTTVLLACLVPETPLGRWFRRHADDRGMAMARLLEKSNIRDLEDFRSLSEAAMEDEPPVTPLLITASVSNLLTRARELRDATSPEGRVGPVALRHVMGGFIYNETFHLHDWKDLQIDRRDWSEAFLWQVWKEYLHEVEAWKDEHRQTFDEEPDVPEGPSTHIATDIWTTDDALGYEAYAYAIARFITHGQTRAPLTISVQAPWGGGKTSLMRMIQKELDPDWSHDIGDERDQPRGFLTVAQLLAEIDEWIGAGTRQDLPRVAGGISSRLLAAWYAALDRRAGGAKRRRFEHSRTSVGTAYEAIQAELAAMGDWVEANASRSLHGSDAPEDPELTLLDRWVTALDRIHHPRAGTFPITTIGEAFDAVKKSLADMEAWVAGNRSEPLPPPGAAPSKLTVWFNAWKYENTSQVWAGLADAIIQQIAARLPIIERERFWLRLNLKRMDADKVRLAVHDRIFAHFWNRLRKWGVGLGAAALAGVGALAGGSITGEPWALWTGGIGLLGSTLLGATAGLVEFLRANAVVKDEPAEVSLSSYLTMPDYRSELGFIHHVQADLQRVFTAVPDEFLPLVIFVDDLDRCSPTKVAQVVEAVNLFLAGEFPHCIFILGMDTEMVAAALQAAHEDMIAQLPGDAGTPVGWKFMDKFVQLPFLIPPAEDRDLIRYTKRLFAARKNRRRSTGGGAPVPYHAGEAAESETTRRETLSPHMPDSRSAPTVDEAPESTGMTGERERLDDLRGRIDAEIQKFSDRNPEIRKLVTDAAVHFHGNPRELKRFVNVFRLNYFLWAVRRSRGLEVPTMRQLLRWSIFSMRWPEVARWLRRGGLGEWEPPGEQERQDGEFVTRLTILEQIAGKAQDLETWTHEVLTRFRLGDDPPRWLEDDDLWSFMRERENDLGESLLLSGGANKGLW